MVLGVFSILPEWSLTPVGNFMDMFKDSQTVPLHEEGHVRPPVEVPMPMHSPVMPSTEKHIHILEWHILQAGHCIQTQTETQICKMVLAKHGHTLNQRLFLILCVVWISLLELELLCS
jgi:hypothetical protein